MASACKPAWAWAYGCWPGWDGRSLLGPMAVLLGAIFWNLAVTIGVIGILHGDSTGFELLEMPPYSVFILFLGYLLLGVCGVLMFHQRRDRQAFVSQWFLLAALFWFPWIYSTAELLLVAFPSRGMAQAVVAWWYADNLLVVWLGLVGLAAIFYFLPRLLGRDLHSHYLALFTFWMLILFGSWAGIPGSAPVPAWMPTLSAVATVLLLIPVLTVALNVHGTLNGNYRNVLSEPTLAFMSFAALAFLAAGLRKVLGTVFDANHQLQFTWFARATTQLYLYGFVALALFGAAYYVVPRLLGTSFGSTKMVRAHLWLALAGIVLVVAPLSLGGLKEASQLNQPNVVLNNIVKATLPFLRVSTLGEMFFLLSNLLFLSNLTGLVVRFYRARAAVAFAAATTDLYKPAEAKTWSVERGLQDQ